MENNNEEVYHVLNDIYDKELKEMPTFNPEIQEKIGNELNKAIDEFKKEQH